MLQRENNEVSPLIAMQNKVYLSGIILGIDSVNEWSHYNVTSSFIDWAHSHNDPCSSEQRISVIKVIFKFIVSLVKCQSQSCSYNQGPLLLTWFNFNPSMDM